jgi:hypothetical protein
MDGELAIQNFQAEIIRVASNTLGRSLSEPELRFITCRSSFVALEAIMDTVSSATKEEVAHYLNSESVQTASPLP